MHFVYSIGHHNDIVVILDDAKCMYDIKHLKINSFIWKEMYIFM